MNTEKLNRYNVMAEILVELYNETGDESYQEMLSKCNEIISTLK